MKFSDEKGFRGKACGVNTLSFCAQRGVAMFLSLSTPIVRKVEPKDLLPEEPRDPMISFYSSGKPGGT